MTRVFRTPPSDPRRLTMLPHQQARQTPGERRRIHGPILPAEPARTPMSRADVAIVIAAIAASAYLVLRLVIPGALWLAGTLGAGL